MINEIWINRETGKLVLVNSVELMPQWLGVEHEQEFYSIPMPQFYDEYYFIGVL